MIARGEAKSRDDSIWIQTIQAKAAAVLLIGNAATAFAQRLDEIVETMERAIFRTAQLAKQYQARVVLLSPSCASMRSIPKQQRGDRANVTVLRVVALNPV